MGFVGDFIDGIKHNWWPKQKWSIFFLRLIYNVVIYHKWLKLENYLSIMTYLQLRCKHKLESLQELKLKYCEGFAFKKERI